MSYLAKEIYEQSEIIENLLGENQAHVEKIAAVIKNFDPTFVMIAARGTSDNAARYAQYLFSIQLGLPVALATPSVHTLYEATPNLSKALVIGISQSGGSHDVRKVIEDANQQGALTLSITNTPDSPLAQASQHHLYLHAGEEKSVAATKTYTTELTTIAMLVDALLDKQRLSDLPQLIQETLKFSQNIPNWIQRYRYASRIATIGRGFNYATAYEISLKIKELCYVTGEEYSEADFRHGPIAVIKEGFPVITIAPKGKPLPQMIELLQLLQEKGAEKLVVTNDPEAKQLADFVMELPDSLPEWLSPICAVIPGQVFAMNLAMTKGHHIDQPIGLKKVTVTI